MHVDRSPSFAAAAGELSAGPFASSVRHNVRSASVVGLVAIGSFFLSERSARKRTLFLVPSGIEGTHALSNGREMSADKRTPMPSYGGLASG